MVFLPLSEEIAPAPGRGPRANGRTVRRRVRRLLVVAGGIHLLGASAAFASGDRLPQTGSALDRLTDSLSHSLVQVVAYRPIGSSLRSGSGPGTLVPLEPFRGILWATGIVVDGRGLVVTCAEAAQPGDSLELWLPDGGRVGARFLAQDADLGVSLLRADSTSAEGGPLSAVPFPREESFRAGDRLLLVHHTAEREAPDVKIGSLAALPASPAGSGRHLEMSLGDCHGSCGGAVIDGEGRFCGMVVGVRVEREADLVSGCPAREMDFLEHEGALQVLTPSALAAAVVRLVAASRDPRGYLGVQVEPAADPANGVDAAGGAPALHVVRVLPGSPADLAGILPGDQVLEIHGEPVADMSEVSERIAATEPGTPIEIELLRKGVPVVVRPVIGDRSALEWMARQEALEVARRKQLRRTLRQLESRLDRLEQSASSTNTN